MSGMIATPASLPPTPMGLHIVMYSRRALASKNVGGSFSLRPVIRPLSDAARDDDVEEEEEACIARTRYVRYSARTS